MYMVGYPRGPGVSAGETDRHQQVAVVARLGCLACEDRWLRRPRERDLRDVGVEGTQAIEEELRVEGDGQLVTFEGRVDRLPRRRRVTSAGFEHGLPGVEGHPYRRGP